MSEEDAKENAVKNSHNAEIYKYINLHAIDSAFFNVASQRACPNVAGTKARTLYRRNRGGQVGVRVYD